jgi:hypothetical protein
MTRRIRRLFAVLTAVAAVAAVALSAAGAGAASAAASNLSQPTSTRAVQVVKYPRPAPLVLDMRFGVHSTYDRVVIDLSGPLTGYSVGYVSRLTYDGSGKAVPLSGKAFLAIRLSPANAHAFVDEHALNVYSGPRLTWPGMPTVKGAAMTGDYEAVVSFGLALDHKAGFRVFTLKNPSRLVVDIAH